MFVSHPDPVFLVRELDRLALVAGVAEARHAGDARRAPTAGAATIRWRLGLALVALGQRLQGAQPVGVARSAAAGIGAAP